MRPGGSIVSRILRLALAASLIASGSVHFHPGESLGARSENRGPWALRSAVSHPDAPLHFESVELERAPRCLDCLAPQRSHALGPARPMLAGVEPRLVDTVAATGTAVLRRASDPGQPRGPPLV